MSAEDHLHPDEFLTLYHTTSQQHAEGLRAQGTASPKPVGARTVDSDYEPGRGMGRGLYLSRRHEEVYGDTAVPVRVHPSELSVPPERAHRVKAGMTPVKSLNVGDGYTEAHLPPERFGAPEPIKRRGRA